METSKNMSLWDCLEKTDPKYTKTFKRPGGFSGTAQNPTYAIKKMTGIFGSCGTGWGFEKPEFQFITANEGEVLIYCTITLWYIGEGGEKHVVYGVGGDKSVSKTKYGLSGDDEACKKATTDALTNAMKYIGMAADIHLGMYDDSKYINSLKQEINGNASQEKKTPPAKPFSNEECALLVQGIRDCKTIDDLNSQKQNAEAARPRMRNDQKELIASEFRTQGEFIERTKDYG